MTAYRSTTYIPPLVEQALKLAEQIDFSASSSIEVGRLLYVLTGHIQEGLIGEIGTGCGVGAAWIASALAPTASFVTIELDEQRSEIVRKLFEAVPNIRVMTGDWHALLNESPFAMLLYKT
ncbi:O-methyltransferase [Tolypothrix sp. VBCCA 56010]|uniref:O-methyltransferase n=1 Tax=Tolypothrix sp. VBCCA 56010 TaxID=3137731 RepID=UPI003D7C5CF1